jgi:hypothetical protein
MRLIQLILLEQILVSAFPVFESAETFGHFQIAPDQVINQRACLTFKVGYEFISKTVETLFAHFVERYNQEEHPRKKREGPSV